LAEADRQHVAWNPKVLDRPRQRERVRRDDADLGLDVDERAWIEALGIDHRVVDVREDLELVGDADVVAVGRKPVRDYAGSHLVVDKRLDHPVLERHLADPAVSFYRHTQVLRVLRVLQVLPVPRVQRRRSAASTESTMLMTIHVTTGK